MIFKVYKYVYYWIFKFLMRFGDYELPFKVAGALSILVMINFVFIYDNVLPITPENTDGIYKYTLIGAFLFILIFNYFMFVHEDRYLNVLEQFKNESDRSRLVGRMAVIAYAMLTFVSIFV